MLKKNDNQPLGIDIFKKMLIKKMEIVGKDENIILD